MPSPFPGMDPWLESPSNFRDFHNSPTIPIPLDAGVPPVRIDLQPLLDRAYDTGRYADGINYRVEADPPLTASQRIWAEKLPSRSYHSIELRAELNQFSAMP
jgi:hypothetical protein